VLDREQPDEVDVYRSLLSARTEHVVEVREPLVLISQVHRSGGTLLNRLFDGHPECHANPRELWIGKRRWPPIASTPPERWFETLFEPRSLNDLRNGFHNVRSDPDVFPFLFPVRLQRELFDRCVAASSPTSDRDVLDCYFTSYFNAWLDNHNLYPQPKKAVTGFVPLFAMKPESVGRYFSAYPDGTLISVVRDPLGWFNSARKLKGRYREVDRAIRIWRKSATAALDARERFGDRVLILTYENLVLDTEATMTTISGRLGLTMHHSLLQPTFNGFPIRANSSVGPGRYGILRERPQAFRDSLDPETIASIEELAGDLYERAAAAELSPV
jgi:hypothetical protein